MGGNELLKAGDGHQLRFQCLSVVQSEETDCWDGHSMDLEATCCEESQPSAEHPKERRSPLLFPRWEAHVDGVAFCTHELTGTCD